MLAFKFRKPGEARTKTKPNTRPRKKEKNAVEDIYIAAMRQRISHDMN